MSPATVAELAMAPSAEIGPGLGAFLAFFVLALALWLLMRNMNGRLRRMSYRDKASTPAQQAATAPEPPGEAEPAESQVESQVERQSDPTP